MKRVAPIFTGDRQLDGFNRDVIAAVGDIYDSLPDDASARIMPRDEYTQLWWPCDDDAGSTTLRNIGKAGGASNSLATGAQALAGQISNQDALCVRLVGGGTASTRQAVGATAETFGSPSSVSLSCKVKLGSVTSGGSYLIGYHTTTPTGVFWLYQASGSIQGYVRVSGTSYNAPAGVDATVSEGQWHAVVTTYDGANIRLYLDGCYVGGQAIAGAPEWGIAGTKSWYLGSLPVVGSGAEGFIRDVRVHNCARSLDWVEEDWLRFQGEW